MSEPTFTAKQIDDFHEYEFVRSMGQYNMFDPSARRATGLTSDEYSFVMKNYSKLKEAAEKASK